MRFRRADPAVATLTDSFHCRSRRRDVTLDQCLDGYVEANAFERRRSACFRCPLGRKNREAFAATESVED
jgi:hypothetical protein